MSQPSTGTIGILNVGAGDTKLVFDKNNPAECIRAARIVKDMIRRGYALLVEVEGKDGEKAYQRVMEFKEDTCEYIIADFDPVTADKADQEEVDEQSSAAPTIAEGSPKDSPAPAKRGRPRTRAIHASAASGIAVGRTAGG